MRKRIMHWVWDGRPRWLSLQLHWLANVLCALHGHEPVGDQCGRPEHDYCVWCMKAMPHGVRHVS